MRAYSADSAAIAIRSLLEPLAAQPAEGIPEEWNVSQPIRAVAWDVYGTLLQSASGEIGSAGSGGLVAAVRQALLAMGRESGGAAALASGFGDAVRRAQERALAAGAARGEIDVRTVWQEVLGTTLAPPLPDPLQFALDVELRHNPTWPMPDAGRVLRELHRRGYAQAIVSNAQFFTPVILQQQLGLGLAEIGISHDRRIWSFEHGVAKPDRSLFRKAATVLSRSGIPASQILYVGNDMLNDVTGAKGAGMQTVLFAGDARSFRARTDDPSVRDIRPDAVILSLQSLLELLP